VLYIVSRISIPIDTSGDAQMLALIESSIRNQFVIRWVDPHVPPEAVRTVSADKAGVRTVDVERYVREEKVLGGEINDSRVLSGVMPDKDIVHPQLHRRIHKLPIVLLDCLLEYKSGESRRMSRYLASLSTTARM
jgi:T-complex protein 1 subunit gamma